MSILIAMQSVMLIMMFVTARQVFRIRHELESITGRVDHYLKVLMAEDYEDEEETNDTKVKSVKRCDCDEEESRLVSAVLGEIFP